jgi:hypothetical protein
MGSGQELLHKSSVEFKVTCGGPSSAGKVLDIASV